MQKVLTVGMFAVSWLLAAAYGYQAAREDLARKHAPNHPDFPALVRAAGYSWSLSLTAAVVSLALVIF